MSVDVSRETLHRIAVSRGRMPPDTGGRAWGGLKRLGKPYLPCTDEDPPQMSTSEVDNQMHPNRVVMPVHHYRLDPDSRACKRFT